MARITVTHRHDFSFDVRVRGYALISDEPVSLGGEDEGPTPTELMVAGLAACAADAATRQLDALGLPTGPVEVDADFGWDDGGRRIEHVAIGLTLPQEVDREARDAIFAAVLECPARLLMVEPPRLDYEIRTPAAVAGEPPRGRAST